MSEFRFFAYTDFAFHPNQSQRLIDLPIQPYRHSADAAAPNASGSPSYELNVPYTVFEVLVAVFAVVGNLMVIIVFQRERKLRRRTNYYIVSLAMADFLVGSLGVPFAILASIGLPTNLYACLFTVSLLIVLCTISIFCLVAVSVDRYWAILYPMAYSRNVRTKTAIVIISLCWLAGIVVGFLPLFGWHADVPSHQACLFTEVMDYNYLVFLYFATIITPALLMLAFYVHIYRVIVRQVRQIVTMNPVSDCSRRSSTAQMPPPGTMPRPCHGGTMLRVLGASRKREVKATQNLSIIVLFFMICWFPLYTINCIQAFCDTCVIPPKLTLFCIILSHLNSAVNPVLYAYHLRDFRAALKNLILRVMGVEVEPTVDPMHRFSLASQHRLQSIDANMRNTLQPRIYIDSPIWLRQQQQQQKGGALQKFAGISPCLNNLNQTVAAVAAVTPEVERQMWNIREVSSGAELGELNYIFPPPNGGADDSDADVQHGGDSESTPTPPPRQNRRRATRQPSEERGASPYSYENRNYTTSDGEMPDEVFLPNANDTPNGSATGRWPNGSLKLAAESGKPSNNAAALLALREKLRSDNADYLTHLHSSSAHVLSDSSHSDCEVAPCGGAGRRLVSASLTSSPRGRQRPLCAQAATASSDELDTVVYVIEQQQSPDAVHANHRSRLKSLKSSRSSNSQRSLSRSCNSDCSLVAAAPTGDTGQARQGLSGAHATTPHPVASSCGALDIGQTPTSINNNSHTANNLNYYAQQRQQSQERRLPSPNAALPPATPPSKFSPLKALFQHSHNKATSEDGETVTPPLTTRTGTPATSTTTSDCVASKEAAEADVNVSLAQADIAAAAAVMKESAIVEHHRLANLVALPASDS